MHPSLAHHLETLYRSLDAPRRLAADPVAWPRRYRTPEDQEVAAVLSSSLAYGRVSLFTPVLARIFALADAAGGPRAWVDGFDPEEDGQHLRPLVYRWNRGVDLVLLAATLQRVYGRVSSLEELMGPREAGMREGLGRLIDALRADALQVAPACGLDAAAFPRLPRGFRYLVPSPRDGSACKRWNMFLRWMIRPAREGVDLGIWGRWSPSDLVIPLDTHVLRIARFLGLTRRRDGSWRTAREVTDVLATFDPADPVRYDFSIAHLGISGACRGWRDPLTCPGCPLEGVCQASPRR